MKLNKVKAVALFAVVSLCLPQIVYAQGYKTGSAYHEVETGSIETNLAEPETVQLEGKKKEKYEKFLSGDSQELDVGESKVIGHTLFGEEIAITCVSSSESMAEESEDGETRDVIETGEIETDFTAPENKIQLEGKKKEEYEKFLSGDFQELDVGESKIIGYTPDNGEIAITCVSSSESLTKDNLRTSKKTYDITGKVLGITTTVIVVDLSCTWYPDGQDGYINNLHGTYSIKNSLWHCKWDEDSKVATKWSHVLFLDVTPPSPGFSYPVLFGASYNPVNSSLSFDMEQ